MRLVISLVACLMLVMTSISGAAHAAGPICSEMANEVAVHVAMDCDEVPADSHKNSPHCHTGCHGHHVAAPIPGNSPARSAIITSAYAPEAQATLPSYKGGRTMRPPRA